VTLGCDTIPERIAYARELRKLPAMLSADEVVRFLEAVSSLKARVALTTAYAAGLRVSEVIGLKAVDIDSDRMVIRIEHGRGGKERYVMLSEQLLGILRSYWRLARPESFLFPGRDKDKPIEQTVLHAACRSGRAAVGIDKRVSVHVLRHTRRMCRRGAASRRDRENLHHHDADTATDSHEFRPARRFPPTRRVLVSRHKRRRPPRPCAERRRDALSP
jgi:integrase